MKKIYLLLVLLISITTYNCTSDTIEDILAVQEDDQEEDGDGEDDSNDEDGDNEEEETPVNFVDDIQPIMNTYCMPCHADPPQGAPIPLVTFEQVMNSTQDNLIDRISLQPGQLGFMPLGGARLEQEMIDLIILWRDEGFLEEAP